MSAEENKAKVRLVIQLEDQGKMEDVVRFFSDDTVFHEPGGVTLRGRDELRERLDMIYSAFPDIHHVIEDLIAADDKVVARFSITGTHQGEFVGTLPTGRQVKFTATVIYQFIGGKIAEAWIDWDALSVMQQIGAIHLRK
jgi:steroid delta-isomerase-like uncharacterized protein